MWVFRINGDTEVYEVGYYDPEGNYYMGFEYASRVDAAQNVHFLNGGS